MQWSRQVPLLRDLEVAPCPLGCQPCLGWGAGAQCLCWAGLQGSTSGSVSRGCKTAWKIWRGEVAGAGVLFELQPACGLLQGSLAVSEMWEAHLQGDLQGFTCARRGFQGAQAGLRLLCTSCPLPESVPRLCQGWGQAVGHCWGAATSPEVMETRTLCRFRGEGVVGTAATPCLAGAGAGLSCTDGRVIKSNKRKETWIRYSLSTLIVLWGPNHNAALLEGIQQRNQTSRSGQG